MGTVKEHFKNSAKWTCPPGVKQIRVIGNREAFPMMNKPAGQNRNPINGQMITMQNKLFGWGGNFNGTIGDSTVVMKSNPVAVLAASNLRWATTMFGPSSPGSVGVGFAQNEAYQLLCWGGKTVSYPLGDMIAAATSSPNLVSGGRQFRKFFAGIAGTYFAIDFQDFLYCWGFNSPQQPLLGTNATTVVSSPVLVAGSRKALNVAPGAYQTFFIDENRDAYGVGDNGVCQLGSGSQPVVPPARLTVSSPTLVAGGKKWAKILPTGGATLGLDMNGDIYGWGQPNYFFLGQLTDLYVSTPTLIFNNMTRKWRDIRLWAYGAAIMALDEFGVWYAWGAGADFGMVAPPVVGSNGQSFSTPTLVIGQEDKRFVEMFIPDGLGSFESTTFALDNNGDMWGIYSNFSGQMGIGSYDNQQASWAKVLAPRPFVKAQFIDQGSLMTCFFMAADGTMYASGNGTYGILGDGTTVNKSIPVMVNAPYKAKVEELTYEKAITVTPGKTYDINIDGFYANFGATQIGQEIKTVDIIYEV